MLCFNGSLQVIILIFLHDYLINTGPIASENIPNNVVKNHIDP